MADTLNDNAFKVLHAFLVTTPETSTKSISDMAREALENSGSGSYSDLLDAYLITTGYPRSMGTLQDRIKAASSLSDTPFTVLTSLL